jgi:hypothetical protein
MTVNGVVRVVWVNVLQLERAAHDDTTGKLVGCRQPILFIVIHGNAVVAIILFGMDTFALV